MEYGACELAENPEGSRAARPLQKGEGPSVYKVHAALAAGYCLFAGGAIVGKFGVHDTSAIIFELVREVLSVIALVAGLFIFEVRLFPAWEDIPRLILAGVAFFFQPDLLVRGPEAR
jgi:hypothetical protein